MLCIILLGLGPQDQPDSEPDILASLMKGLQPSQNDMTFQPAELPTASTKSDNLQTEAAPRIISRGNTLLCMACVF